MSQSSWRRAWVIVLLSQIFSLVSYTTLWAAPFCVANEAELLSALYDAAINGDNDIIQIVAGTYIGSFVYSSGEQNDLTMEGGYSAGCGSRTVDPANTVLDGNNSQPVLVLNCTQKANFSVEGLTIQNGKTTTNNHGGGLHVNTNDGNFSISRSVFNGNYATGSGGGLYVNDATDVVVTGTIFNNNQCGSSGGGFQLSNVHGAVQISQNSIGNNSATIYWGGGISISALYTAYVTLDNNLISNNNGHHGGGVYINSPIASLTCNVISSNSTADYGGGAWLEGTNITVSRNLINSNTAKLRGGGLLIKGTDVTLSSNLIHHNQAGTTDGSGGGIRVERPTTLNLTNNTIVSNDAIGTTSAGGGLWLSMFLDAAVANIYNNLILNNTSSTCTDMYINEDEDNDYNYSTVNLFHSDFDWSENGSCFSYPSFRGQIDVSNLNNVNPLFIDPANGNYRLDALSTVVDAGANGAPGMSAVDKDGNPRIINTTVDMGAYEYLLEASFSADTVTGSSPLTVTFSDTSLGSVSAWLWDFGDGATNSTDRNPVHVYNTRGIYTVTLTVQDTSGKEESEKKTAYIRVDIHPLPPYLILFD